MATKSIPPESSTFHKEKHVKYWLRCLKTHLPTAYIPNESQRVTLAFFILSALDILDVLHFKTTPAERAEYKEWILRCQHPEGGFRGFTGTMYGRNAAVNEWDAANLAATYFALAALIVLGEDLEGVKRRETLDWVRSLQRSNGSFGEVIGRDGDIEGGEDMRFCYLAAGVRWMLRKEETGGLERVEDIDVESLVRWIESSVAYEGGFAQAPFHEAHAGLTYSGVGALSLLGRLSRKGLEMSDRKTISHSFVEGLIKWLVSRQTLMISEIEDGLAMAEENGEPSNPMPATAVYPPKFHVQGAHPASLGDAGKPEFETIEVSPEDMLWIGVNGRTNKVADTCYTFWVGGTLGILNQVHLQDFNGIRRFLLEKTQHKIMGGFGKMPGDLPDILHSYLGLANLAVMREPDLKSIDPTLCISVSTREEFERKATTGRRSGSLSQGHGQLDGVH